MGRTYRFALIVLVATTVLGGCGGADDGGGGDVETEVPAELEGAADEALVVTDFCEAARVNAEAGQALATFAADGTPPRPEAEIAAAVDPVRESNEQMLAAAPEEVRPDAEVLAELAELRMAAFEANGGDPVAANQDPAYLEKVETTAEPGARFQQYLRTRCGIDAT